MPESTHPEDFDPIFSQEVVIVGGHAVNLWASFYASRGDAELRAFAPFTSKDADIFLKDKDLALAVAAAAGWQFRNNPEPRSPILGAIVLQKDGVELQVDVLRAVTGLTDAELSETVPIEFEDGRRYFAPPPDMMLKAKLSNLATHDQRDRQDERHVRILIKCCGHFLKDVAAAARAGDMPERDAVEYFMRTHRLITAPSSETLDRRHALGLARAIPTVETAGDLSTLPRLGAFFRHQRPADDRT